MEEARGGKMACKNANFAPSLLAERVNFTERSGESSTILCALVGVETNRPRAAQAIEMNGFHNAALSASCVKATLFTTRAYTHEFVFNLVVLPFHILIIIKTVSDYLKNSR